MSSGTPDLPVAAPWQTQYHRYPVQTFTYEPATAASQQGSLVIPAGQWWRIVTVGADLTTDANVADRRVVHQVTDLAGVNVEEAMAPTATPASQVGFMRWSTNFQFTGVQETNGNTYTYGVLVPILWPQGYTLTLFISNGQATDRLSNMFAAVEIYTEDRSSDTGALIPATTPIVV